MPDEPQPAPAPAPDQIAEQLDETDEVLEALHNEGVLDEQRHGELLEVMRECREQLRQLLNREQTESPMLVTLQTQMAELQTRMEAELTGLRTQLETQRAISEAPSSQPQSESTPRTESGSPKPEKSTGELEPGALAEESPAESPPPPPKKRVRKI